MNKVRTYTHWTPHYFKSKIAETVHRRKHPNQPWFTQSANRILKSLLRDSDVGLEFGSGRSTPWIAQRIRFLTSVEHNLAWYATVKQLLIDNNVTNVDYHLYATEQGKGTHPAYIGILQKFPRHSLDFVVVDGKRRHDCAYAALDIIRPGGFLLLDDANRYLPSNSNSPLSRTFTDGPLPNWMDFLTMVRDWRCIWTSNGITDTAIYLKPC